VTTSESTEPSRDDRTTPTTDRRLSLFTLGVLSLGLMYGAYAWADLDLTQGAGTVWRLGQVAPALGVLLWISRDSDSKARLVVLTGFAACGATVYQWHWKWVHLTGPHCMKIVSCSVGELLWPLLFVSFLFVVAVLVAARQSRQQRSRSRTGASGDDVNLRPVSAATPADAE
jgi:hypothetical protein